MHLKSAQLRRTIDQDVITATEYELIEQCRAGNRKAQKAIFDRLSPKMFPVCIRYVADRAIAQDILQEGFITLFQKIDTYKGDGSFEGWARRIFITSCLMYLRKNDAIKMSEELDSAYGLKAEDITPIENIGYKELLKLITELPPGFRTVFNMYVLEDYTHKEIAEELGITEATSRSQLKRAREWLQNRIKNQ
jgi:RNA polymerase sigma-70 factor (ECF subfamily)